MRYASLSLLFAATITMLTPATAQQSLSCWSGGDDKRAASSGNSCNWQHGSTVGSIACSCNTDRGDQSDLAKFFTVWDFKGFQYNAFGIHGECYNLQWKWEHGKGSMQIGADTPLCWIFTQPNCVTSDPSDTLDVGRAGLSQFPVEFDGKISSFSCDPYPEA